MGKKNGAGLWGGVEGHDQISRRAGGKKKLAKPGDLPHQVLIITGLLLRGWRAVVPTFLCRSGYLMSPGRTKKRFTSAHIAAAQRGIQLARQARLAWIRKERDAGRSTYAPPLHDLLLLRAPANRTKRPERLGHLAPTYDHVKAAQLNRRRQRRADRKGAKT